MDINADFAQPASVHAQDIPWVPSPMPGVERRMLDRMGGEVARATSIVRYAPGSAFSAHTHTGGEEYLVLEGVFQDEHGDFPAGTYVRNPPTSSHTPRADNGATILVKLWQFDMEDRHQLSVDTTIADPVAIAPGVSEIPLYTDSRERVRIEVWDANTKVKVSQHKGFEALVLEGSFRFEDQTYKAHSWLRLPPNYALEGSAGELGARLWIKSDHLGEPQLAPQDRTPSN
ncbi:MAG: cupin domain-containing protein [Pseudomonadota bacterium]